MESGASPIGSRLTIEIWSPSHFTAGERAVISTVTDW
jgi:hypothetical protein